MGGDFMLSMSNYQTSPSEDCLLSLSLLTVPSTNESDSPSINVLSFSLPDMSQARSP